MPAVDTEQQPITLDGDSLEGTLWNPQQAARAAGVKPGTVAWWAHRGYLKRANSVTLRTPLYRALDVLATESEVNSRRSVKRGQAAA
jgi:hypothetical protein